jgi:hypothetical protein
MGKRSGLAETEAEVAKMTLAEIDKEIERCHKGAYAGGAAAKGFFKRLVWMEGLREKLHGTPASRRLWRER